MRAVRSAIASDCMTLREDMRRLESDMSTGGGDPSALTRLRRTTYVSGIVQAYGLLEQSVDRILIRAAELYGDICASYDDLPDRVRAEFKKLGLQAVLDGERARLRVPIDESAVFSSLISETPPTLRKLVAPVFTRAQANYRHPLIREMLNRLDIPFDAPVGAGVSADLGVLGKSSSESAILDLVSRRNELAHAYAVPDDILSADQIIAVVNVVEGYLGEVVEAATSRLLSECENGGRIEVIGSVAHRWSSSIGLDMTAGSLSVGDNLVFKRKGGRYLSRRVDSLMLNKTVTGSVSAPPGSGTIQVGIGFRDPSPRQLEGALVFLLPQSLDDLLPSRSA